MSIVKKIYITKTEDGFLVEAADYDAFVYGSEGEAITEAKAIQSDYLTDGIDAKIIRR